MLPCDNATLLMLLLLPLLPSVFQVNHSIQFPLYSTITLVTYCYHSCNTGVIKEMIKLGWQKTRPLCLKKIPIFSCL